MYGIAITVAACLQSGTRADVAWLVETDGLAVSNWSDAVVFTPGGGRIGSLLGGVLDHKLADLSGRWSSGRLVDIEITEVDAVIGELPTTGRLRCLLAPAATLPPELWGLADDRHRFCLVTELSGDEVTGVSVYSEATISAAGAEVERVFASGRAGSTMMGDRVVSLFSAVPQMIIVGDTPVAEELAAIARLLGWHPRIVNETAQVSGLIAPLSGMDMVVVTGHDLELVGGALTAAVASRCGYIGSLGSRQMQEDRADWLTYRGVTDLDRIRGPAGLDIGATTPGEIAVAIVAEAIAERATSGRVNG